MLSQLFYSKVAIIVHTLFRQGRNISYRIEILKKANLHVCRAGVRGGQLVINLISQVNKRCNVSDVRWSGGLFQKCVPSMVAETSFQKIGMGLKQRQFFFNISESIVHAEGFK